jgi:Ca2+-binding EF-hand superfamily protein
MKTNTNKTRHHQMKITLTLCALAICSAMSLQAADEKSNATPQQEEMFKRIEANGDGKLTKTEFMAFPAFASDTAKAEGMWQHISNGKETVTLAEFLAVVSASEKKDKAADEKPNATPQQEEMFKKLDSNGDGKVTKAEFMAFPAFASDTAKAEGMWQHVSNGKEEFTLAEFLAVANGHKPNKAQVTEMFKKCDANGDGKLTKAEFMVSPIAKEDAATAEQKWQHISNGKEAITLEEFIAVVTGGKQDKTTDEKPRANPQQEMFKRLDANGDGKVTKAEFMTFPESQSDAAKAEQMWQHISNGKEALTLAEFIAVVSGGKQGKSAAGKSNTSATASTATVTDPEAMRKRLTDKVERVTTGVKKWAESGRDPSDILKEVEEKLKPLLDGGKAVEAEAELDRLLEQLKQEAN